MAGPSTITFLFGNDEFAIARRLAELRSSFGDPASADLNTVQLDARSMSDDELNNAVNTLPFLAKSRLVLLANPSARYATPPQRKKFFDFLEKVPETARLVIYEPVELKTFRDIARQDREDEKHWLVKWIKKTGRGLERHALPAQREMAGRIASQVKEQGGQIERPAAEKLAELVGADPRQAAQEVGKLLAFVNWARPITLKDVETVSIFTAEPDIFSMVDALGSGDGRSAQKLMHRLIERNDAFSVWGMVVRQFRLLLQARELMDQKGGPREIEQALGLPSFVAEKISAQARRFSMPSLEKVYHKLLSIDQAVKRSQVTLDLALETLVVELTA